MRWLCVAAAFVLGIHLGFAQDVSPGSLAAKLAALRSHTTDGIIPFNQQMFQEYALQSGRTYSLVFFLTADYLIDNPQLRLRELYKEFKYTATAFIKGPDPNKVFFGVIKFEESQELFRQLGVNTLPFAFHWGPGQTPRASGRLQISEEDRLQNAAGWTAEVMAAFTQQRTGANHAEIDKPSILKSPLFPFIVLGVLVLLAVSAWRFYTSPLAQSKGFWMFGSLAIYWFSSSGGMYNIIRGMPMYIINQEKKIQYFLAGRGNQLGVEGFTMGSTYLGTSLAVAVLTYLVPQLKVAKQRNGVALACIVGAVFLMFKIFELYKWKAGYWLQIYLP